MKGMPLPFDFEGKGVLDLELLVNSKSFFSDINNNNNSLFKKNPFSLVEPTSVLDSARFPSRPTSSSTLSSSLGGGGGGAGGGASTTATSSNAGGGVVVDSELLPIPPSLEIGTGVDKCAMEEWEGVLSESPNQEQSIFRWIMGGDVEDPSSMGSLNRVLQLGGGGGGGGAAEFEFSGGVDQGFGGEHQFGANFIPNFPNNNRSNTILYPSNNLGPISLHNQNTTATTTTTTTTTTFDSSPEIKPPIFNLINQHQTHNPQNPSFFLPLSYGQQQEQSLFVPPQAKRHNPGGGGYEISATKGSFSENDSFNPARQQQQQQFLPNQLQFLPHYLQQRPKTGVGDEMGSIIDQIHKASELIVQTGNNPVLAQGILARLNHQLSPIGKPFQRAAFYCKESLQLLLQTNNINNLNNPSITSSTPFSLIFKIGAFKSYSEISPLIPFANFTCNQAILEVLEGFDRIHVLDFDIGYGGQWASLMQELSLRSGGAPSLKITALASPSTHDPIELGLTRENLIQFASDVNISFEFDVMNVDSLNSCSWSLPFQPTENEAIAVNLPIGCLSNYQVSLPLVLRFVKQLSPRIVVSIDKGCDRNDLPFANHVVHALHSYTNLLESLDAVNVNMDALQKIERFMVQPAIEKIVMGRFRFPEKSQHWRTLFMSCGFTPITFSNFTESQAECVVKRTPVRGFQVEKRQSSLVLCWQRKELISVSAWRC